MSTLRQERAAFAFNIEHDTNLKHFDFSAKLQDLEKVRLQESRLWWDLTTLNKYVEKGMIPRGLRIKKIPTTIFSEVFTKEWNEILSSCSIKLMELIVKYEDEKLKNLSVRLEDLDKDLSAFKSLKEYQEQIQRMEDVINKQEENISIIKRSKLQRDMYDYSHDQVYEWGRRMKTPTTPRSILKRKNKGDRNQRNSRASVVFSEPENSENLDTSTEEMQATTSTPKQSYFKNKKQDQKSKNDEGGAGGNIKNQLRMQTRRNNQNS